MTIGDRIKYLREKKGIAQVDLADCAHVSKQTLYKYENNIVTNIPSDKIERLSGALAVSPAFLMGWTDTENDTPTTPLPVDDDKIILSKRDTDPELLQIMDIFGDLNGKGKHQLLIYAKWLWEQDEFLPAKPIKRAMAAYGGGVKELPPLNPDDE